MNRIDATKRLMRAEANLWQAQERLGLATQGYSDAVRVPPNPPSSGQLLDAQVKLQAAWRHLQKVGEHMDDAELVRPAQETIRRIERRLSGNISWDIPTIIILEDEIHTTSKFLEALTQVINADLDDSEGLDEDDDLDDDLEWNG